MAGLTEDMTRQHDDIESLRRARGLLMGKLGHDAHELKADVADFLTDFRKRHMEIGRATRRDLMEFTSDIKDHVLVLKRDVAHMKAGFLRGHMEMADIQKDQLHTYISELKADVANLLSGYRAHRQEVSEETKAKLLTAVFNIKEYITDLTDDVSEMISGFQQDHAEMARKGKDERKTFLSGLTQDVTALKKEIASLRKDFSEDISGARKVWAGPSPEELKVLARRRSREEARKKRADAKNKPSDSVVPDDLTSIQGIGPGMQGHLNNAGIYTFARLAKSEPKELRRILGKPGRAAAVEKWIRQAKRLTGE